MARKPKGSYLPLNHTKKFSDYMGYITPIACFDVIPGDKINHKIHALIRTQPLLAPVMHEVDIELHAYFVPDRLVYEDAEEFQTGGDLGTSSPTRPTMAAPASTGYAIGSLADYYGLPTGVPDYVHDAKPIRGYNLIWNYHYRDSQLQTEKTIDLTGGLDTTTPKDLLRPAWKRDYFTKCRPEPQLGAEVVIPIGDRAPVTGIGTDNQTYTAATVDVFETDGTGAVNYTHQKDFNSSGANTRVYVQQDPNNAGFPNIWADLSDVTGIPIRELREANAVQRFLEKNNIFGGRYMEQLMARFGVFPQDARLQWPEFLGAGQTKLQFSEVLQTGGTDAGASTGVGNMKGHGISIIGSNRYKYRVKEHGYIHVFMITRPKTQYMQGLHRMWSRETRYDYLLPEFVNVGDQAVLKKELYVGAADPEEVFGYTPIYEDYRTIPSTVSGEFRTTLDYWHMARKFSSEPSLNSDFIMCNPTNRIFPATSAAQLYVNVKHDISAYRPLPKTPSYALK